MQHADAAMAELMQVQDRLLGGGSVIRRHRREVERVDARVHEHGRQVHLPQPLVVLVRRVGLAVVAAEEDHARHLLLQEQVDVVRLGDAAGVLLVHSSGV